MSKDILGILPQASPPEVQVAKTETPEASTPTPGQLLLRAWSDKHGITEPVNSIEDLVLRRQKPAISLQGVEDYSKLFTLDYFSYREFAPALIKIIDLSSNLIPLVLNFPQLKVLKAIEDDYGERGMARVYILKARREGVSTLAESLLVHRAVTMPYRQIGIMAHDDETTNYLFNMAKLMYDQILEVVQPNRRKGNRKELIFANEEAYDGLGLQSGILVQTGGSKTLGRGKTFHDMHLSEIAWWEKPEDVMYGLKTALSHTPGSLGIAETTANGFNYAKDMWDSACMKGRPGWNYWTPCFISWLEMPTYRRSLGVGFDERMNEFEQRMVDLGADLEQIAWHRFILKHDLDGDYNKFDQEYPTIAEDAFIASGGLVFPIDGLKRIEAFIKDINQPQRGELN